MNREHIMRGLELGPADLPDLEETRRELESGTFGSAEALITHAVDVSAFVEHKRAAMLAHGSQIAEDSFFLAMPPEAFSHLFGTEWYIERGAPRGAAQPFSAELFAS
jgi:LmbE family N-acetylglucosaminyl deacetylase